MELHHYPVSNKDMIPNWHADVRIAFHWLREVLLKPLRPSCRAQKRTPGRMASHRRQLKVLL